ncbi:MAG: MFS transporter [Lentihominibacter sp.]
MKNNRWVILTASTIINFCITIIYAWSVFAGPLMELFGWTAAATALTYTIANAVSPVPMIAGGRILNRFGPRRTVICCAFLFGGGLFLSGFTKTVGWLYVTYGICCGVGMAVIYICTISNTVRFFPDKKGLASGILTAGAGMSSIVAAPVAQMLINMKDVLFTFRIFGLIYFIIIIICALFLEKAPEEGISTGAAGNGSCAGSDCRHSSKSGCPGKYSRENLLGNCLRQNWQI